MIPDTVVIEVVDLSGRSDTRRVLIPRYDPVIDPPLFSDIAVTLPATVTSVARWFRNDTGENALIRGLQSPSGARPSIVLKPDAAGDYWVVAVVSERHWLAIGPVTPARDGYDPRDLSPAIQ